MDVLRRMLRPLEQGATVLDLQVIRPNPRVEVAGQVLCEIESESLFRAADAAAAAIDGEVSAGNLVEEAVDDHHVFRYFRDGRALVANRMSAGRSLPAWALPVLHATEEPCRVRERCRLRRLRVARRPPAGVRRAVPGRSIQSGRATRSCPRGDPPG